MRTVSKRIIVVEDVNEFMQREQSLLNRQELNVLTVRSGDEALFRARNDKPDLVILNFFMPNLNGYAVCQKLKSDPGTEDIPILIISAHADEDEDPCMITEEAGCDGCIEKPILYENIVPAVEKLLEIPPRRHIRLRTSLSGRIEDEDGLREAAILNLTPGGVYMETNPTPWPGDIIMVTFSPEDADKLLTFQMAVRWSSESGANEPGGAGCEFLGEPSEVVRWYQDQTDPGSEESEGGASI